MFRIQALKLSSPQWVLAIILIAAFLLHVPGLFYGIPMKNNVGDEVTIMSTIFKMFDDHTLRPDYASFYHLPMTVYLQIPFYLILVLFLLGSGIFPDIESLKNFVMLDYGILLPFARLIAALFATLAGFLIYRVMKKIGGSEKAALLASFLLSFNLMFFQVTHFGRAWSLQIALLLIALMAYLSWNEKEDPKRRDYAWVALTSFLTYGVHLVGGFVYAVFVVFFLSKIRRFKEHGQLKRHLQYFTATTVSLVLVLLVYYILHPAGVLVYLTQPSVERAAGAVEGFLYNLKYYAWIFSTYDTLLAVLSIPAFVYLYKRKKEIALGLFAYIAVHILSIAYAVHSEPRFIVSTMPFLVIPTAFFIVAVFDMVQNQYIRRTLYSTLVLFILLLPLAWTRAIILPNTLLSARSLVMNTLPADTSLITNNFYIDIPENKKAAAYAAEKSVIADTTERRAIVSLPEELLGKPRYFARIDGKLGAIADKSLSFKYAVISFWNEEEAQALKMKLPVSAKLIRSLYPTEKVRSLTDIANNMHSPFQTLLNIRMTGPYVEIYSF
ncbi:MAG TPA: phospholipid carrier-dependent glycosyltransferase [Candidatus Paceibacterota bacterium]